MTDSYPAFLCPNWAELNELRGRFGDSFYILDDARFENNFLSLQDAFRGHYENTWIGYSYKTNYTPFLCSIVDRLGGYAEVVSEMEYELAERVGVAPCRIILNGPMKSETCIARALLQGSQVNLDSIRDLGLLMEIANENPERDIEVSLRCNFPLGSSFVSRFGFDVEGEAFQRALLSIEALPNVKLVGLHCHFPDRDLKSYKARVAKMLELSERIFRDHPPKYINVGGGYFSSMPEELKKTFSIQHVAFGEYAEVLAAPMARAYGNADTAPKLFLEPGTALVADTFHFFARVMDVKQIGDVRFATVDGSIFNISASARKSNLPVRVINADDTAESLSSAGTDIVGYTCIEGDCLTRGYRGAVRTGDFVHYSNVGSYSVVMKPPFILPNVAILRFDHNVKDYSVIKSRENFDNIFSTFVY